MTAAGVARAALRLVAIATLLAALAPVQAVLVRAAPRRAGLLARWFHRRACGLLGLAVRVSGVPSPVRPTLYVANHVSYLDVVVIGAAVDAGFVAKRDVAAWPGIGFLARLQRTVFVARRRDQVGAQVAAMRARLAAGDSLVLFPEGTSSDGGAVLAFKSALFAAAQSWPAGREPAVQPLWIAYRALDGTALTAETRARVAWYGDMTLVPHLLRVLGHRRIAVELGFAPPMAAATPRDRKLLARQCRQAVATGLATALAGPAWWRPRDTAAGRADLTAGGPVLSS